MKVPGIIVARTDAESANLLDCHGARPEHLHESLRRKRLMTLIHLFLIHLISKES